MHIFTKLIIIIICLFACVLPAYAETFKDDTALTAYFAEHLTAGENQFRFTLLRDNPPDNNTLLPALRAAIIQSGLQNSIQDFDSRVEVSDPAADCVNNICEYNVILALTRVPETYPAIASEAELTALLKDALIHRQEHTVFTYRTEKHTDSETYRAMIDNALAAAFTHNGNATEGDYLLAHTQKYSVDWSAQRSDCTEFTGVCQFPTEIDFTYLSTAAEEASMNDLVNGVLGKLDRSENDIDCIRSVYAWLTSHIISTGEGSSAYSCLSAGQCDSRGLSALAYRLLLSVGIDARRISGDSRDWLIIKLYGNYYNADPAADLGRSVDDWQNFMKGAVDDSFAGAHERSVSKLANIDYASDAFLYDYPMVEKSYVEVTPKESVETPEVDLLAQEFDVTDSNDNTLDEKFGGISEKSEASDTPVNLQLTFTNVTIEKWNYYGRPSNLSSSGKIVLQLYFRMNDGTIRLSRPKTMSMSALMPSSKVKTTSKTNPPSKQQASNTITFYMPDGDPGPYFKKVKLIMDTDEVTHRTGGIWYYGVGSNIWLNNDNQLVGVLNFSEHKGDQPYIQPLAEDAIGAFTIDQVTKQKTYLIFHTYDICMRFINDEERCTDPHYCYMKEWRTFSEVNPDDALYTGNNKLRSDWNKYRELNSYETVYGAYIEEDEADLDEDDEDLDADIEEEEFYEAYSEDED